MSYLSLCGRVGCLSRMLVDDKPADWERLKLQMMVEKIDEKKVKETEYEKQNKTPTHMDCHFGKEERLFSS